MKVQTIVVAVRGAKPRCGSLLCKKLALAAAVAVMASVSSATDGKADNYIGGDNTTESDDRR